jgi:cytoskeletal protein RodZ
MSEIREDMKNKDRVGQILRRERLLKDISIEKISDDLKLNSAFIVGIEESDYSNLPSIPYIKVYIKSIAKYLDIDNEPLLKKFAEEQNIQFSNDSVDRRDTITIKIQGEKNSSKVPVYAVAIIFLIVVALLLKNQGSKNKMIEDKYLEMNIFDFISLLQNGMFYDDNKEKYISHL